MINNKRNRFLVYLIACVALVLVIIAGIKIYWKNDAAARAEKYRSILVDSMNVDGAGRNEDVFGCWFSIKVYEVVSTNKTISPSRFDGQQLRYTLTLFDRKSSNPGYTVYVYEDGILFDKNGYYTGDEIVKYIELITHSY